METLYIKCIVPFRVIKDNRLTSLEKLILIHMISFSKNNDVYCWSTNQYFCDIYKVSRQTISKSINNFVKLGYLRSKYDKFNGRTRKEKSTYLTNFMAKLKV